MAGRKRQKAEVTEAVGYLRVSTTEQADSGLSLDAQRARIEAQCAANGWRLVDVFVDSGISAKTLDRPGLQDALATLKPGRVLLALKLDRLTRSVPDLYVLDERVQRTGGEWATVAERIDTTSATGRMMRTLIATLAEWEREVIAERTVAALATKRTRGERLGTTPLGYTTERAEDGTTRLVPNAEEQATVAMARALRAEGMTLARIAAKLAETGHRTKRGGHWDATTVRLLIKPRYVETMSAAESAPK